MFSPLRGMALSPAPFSLNRIMSLRKRKPWSKKDDEDDNLEWLLVLVDSNRQKARVVGNDLGKVFTGRPITSKGVAVKNGSFGTTTF